MYEEQQPALKWLREQLETALDEFRIGDGKRLNQFTETFAFQMYFNNVMRIPAMTDADWLSYPGNIAALEAEYNRFQESANAKNEIAELKDSNTKLAEALDKVQAQLAAFIEAQQKSAPEPEKTSKGKGKGKQAAEADAEEEGEAE